MHIKLSLPGVAIESRLIFLQPLIHSLVNFIGALLDPTLDHRANLDRQCECATGVLEQKKVYAQCMFSWLHKKTVSQHI